MSKGHGERTAGSFFLACFGRAYSSSRVGRDAARWRPGWVYNRMNKSPAIERFYTTRTWRRCRAEFIKSRGRMCEECWKRGVIETGSKGRPLEVHHIIPLTDENMNDPAITMGWDNLQLLCKDCHDAKKNQSEKTRRYRVDEDGRVFL